MLRLIYDLDHTLIDSSHRQATLPNGDLDLAHWIENSTYAKVQQDTLLPLAEDCKRNIGRRNVEVIACTARVMGEADHDYLLGAGLLFDRVLSRWQGCKLADSRLKEILLWQDAMNMGISFAQYIQQSAMFDDNKNVLKRLRAIGFKCYDAISLNETLKTRATA